MNIESIPTWLKMGGGFICFFFTAVFGGMDALLWTLLAFIVLDYVTGILAAVITKSLSSTVGFYGLLKKAAILAVVAVAHLIGQVVGLQEIRSFVIGFYIANEGLSILENAGRLGVPLPEKMIDVLEKLKTK